MRHHRHHRLATRVGLTLAIAAAAAPGAAVAASPDAADYNDIAVKERALQTADKVTPDARDAADKRPVVSIPRPRIVVQQVSPADGGIDWGDVGLGAAGALGLVLVASGGALTVTRRRAGHTRPA
jgi:hypothetical protein